MSKKQVGFQVASYVYPEDYFAGGTPMNGSKNGRIRSEVEALQAAGWEVIKTEVVMTVQDQGTNTNLNLLVALVKYEYVDEPVSQVSAKKVAEEDESVKRGRPAKSDK